MKQFIAFFSLIKIGIFLNLIGTIMVALSFGKNLEDAYQMDKNGKRIYLASFLYPSMFKVGLLIICIGFILQLF